MSPSFPAYPVSESKPGRELHRRRQAFSKTGWRVSGYLEAYVYAVAGSIGVRTDHVRVLCTELSTANGLPAQRSTDSSSKSAAQST